MFVCEKNNSCCDYAYWDDWEDVEQEAKECGHLIEVAEVKHGEWIKNRWNDCSCSNCNAQYVGSGAMHWRYCPNCGAKMEDE